MKENPPKKALQFLRWFCREDYLEEIEGDLTEVFKNQYESDPRKAKWKFARSVIRYFRPEFFKPLKDHYQSITKNTFSKIYFNVTNLLIPIVFIGVIIIIVLALVPVQINRENSAEMKVIVTAVRQGGLKDITFSLEGIRGIYYISHATKKNLNADCLVRLIDKKVTIFYSKPHFLSRLSPMTNSIQITELRLGDEVIFSEIQ